MARTRSIPKLPAVEEEAAPAAHKPCEEDGDDVNCMSCPEFDSCQIIPYDSYDESDDDEKDTSVTGLSLI